MAILARLITVGLLKEALDDKDPDDLEEETVPVSSSAIRTIGWRSDGVITVEFNRGGTYSYAGSRELFDAFISAPSKGVFFNENFQVRR